jgi:hypothetical protein
MQPMRVRHRPHYISPSPLIESAQRARKRHAGSARSEPATLSLDRRSAPSRSRALKEAKGLGQNANVIQHSSTS